MNPEQLHKTATVDALNIWLRENRPDRLADLFATADRVRCQTVGDAVHLRGLIEISNHCVRYCAYCGLRQGNFALTRYRMNAEEIITCTRQALAFGCGTVVLQGGEDPGLTSEFLARLVRRIKSEMPLAVTLSLGERSEEDLALWREAGADRYLLRFETSDRLLFNNIHPSMNGKPSDRISLLRHLRKLGYEIGSGIMVGLPGQTYESIAQDLMLFQELDLDMIGIGPFIPHPATPLGISSGNYNRLTAGQAPRDVSMACRVLALARIMCPEANIPSTTALATLNKENGRELGLQSGANVIMPNLTPTCYKKLYEIYPAKACINETGETCHVCLLNRLAAIGRQPASGQGCRRKSPDFCHPAISVATATCP